MALKIIALVLLAESLAAVGQIFFKKSTNEISPYSLRGVSAHIRFLLDVLAKPYVWAGLLLMAIGLVVWIVALSEGDLSLVYPVGSLQYIIILISAHIFLGEKIDGMKLLGTVLVVFGVVLAAMS